MMTQIGKHLQNRGLISGGGALAAGVAVERVLRFVRNVVLARVLTPEDLGQSALIISFLAVLESISSTGVKQSIIQNENGKELGFLNAAWWVSASSAGLIFVVAASIAPIISSFYSGRVPTLMLIAAALCIVCENAVSPVILVMQREFRFKPIVILSLSSSMVNLALALGFSYVFKSVWGIVIGLVGQFFFKVILSFMIAPFRPRLPLDRAHLRAVLDFTKRSFGLPLLLIAYIQADVVVLARCVPLGDLGIYGMAAGLAAIPYSLFSGVLHPITLPLLSNLQADRTAFFEKICYLNRCVWIYGLPVVFLVSIEAQTVLKLVYGSQYASGSAVLILLCTSTFLRLMGELLAVGFIALGEPQVYRRNSVIRTFVLITTLIPFISIFGTVGAATAMLTATSLFAILTEFDLRRLLGYEGKKFWQTAIPGVWAILPIAGSVPLFRLFSQNAIAELALTSAFCLAIWAVAAWRQFGLRTLVRRLLRRPVPSCEPIS
jgi:O-antigen/teichoic acid export membrane protein